MPALDADNQVFNSCGMHPAQANYVAFPLVQSGKPIHILPKIKKETPEVTFSLRKILSWLPSIPLFKTCPITRQKSTRVYRFCCLASSSPKWLRLLATRTKPAVDSAVNATPHFWAECRRRSGLLDSNITSSNSG
jgi:hypothetical protein